MTYIAIALSILLIFCPAGIRAQTVEIASGTFFQPRHLSQNQTLAPGLTIYMSATSLIVLKYEFPIVGHSEPCRLFVFANNLNSVTVPYVESSSDGCRSTTESMKEIEKRIDMGESLVELIAFVGEREANDHYGTVSAKASPQGVETVHQTLSGLRRSLIRLKRKKAAALGQTASPVPAPNEDYCRAYARRAIEQYREANKAECFVIGQRWIADYDDHLEWCAKLLDREPAEEETAERKSYLAKCRPYAGQGFGRSVFLASKQLRQFNVRTCASYCELNAKCVAWQHFDWGNYECQLLAEVDGPPVEKRDVSSGFSSRYQGPLDRQARGASNTQ